MSSSPTKTTEWTHIPSIPNAPTNIQRRIRQLVQHPRDRPTRRVPTTERARKVPIRYLSNERIPPSFPVTRVSAIHHRCPGSVSTADEIDVRRGTDFRGIEVLVEGRDGLTGEGGFGDIELAGRDKGVCGGVGGRCREGRSS